MNEGVLGVFELEGLEVLATLLVASEEDVEEVHVTVAEEVLANGGQEVGAHEEVVRTDGALEVHPKVEEAGKNHPSTPITTTNLHDPSPVEVRHCLTTSVASITFSWSRHYARLKSTKLSQTLIGLPAPDQLSCNNHSFFEGLYPNEYEVFLQQTSVYRKLYL